MQSRDDLSLYDRQKTIVTVFLDFPLEYIDLDDFSRRCSRLKKIPKYPSKLISLYDQILKKRLNSNALTDLECFSLRKKMKTELNENNKMNILLETVGKYLKKDVPEKEVSRNKSPMNIVGNSPT